MSLGLNGEGDSIGGAISEMADANAGARKNCRFDFGPVRYHDIDDSLSPQTPREMKYQIMEPLRVLSIADPAGFEAEWAKEVDATQGRSADEWPGPRGISLRDDVTPDCELFYDDHYRRLFCTDAFALRVLNAGCVGVAFADPTHLYGQHCRFRLPEGLMEYVSYDEAAMRLKMTLVEAIP